MLFRSPSVEWIAALLGGPCRVRHGDEAALHVARSAAVELSVLNHRLELALGGRGNDVVMSVKGQRAGAVADIAGDDWTAAAWFFDLEADLAGTWTINAGGTDFTVVDPTSIEDLTDQLAAAIRAHDASLAPAISGTVVTFDDPWPEGALPAGLEYSISPFNPNEGVDEADQVDTLNVSHGDRKSTRLNSSHSSVSRMPSSA